MENFKYLLIDPAYLTDDAFSKATLDLKKPTSTLTVGNTKIIALSNEIGNVSFGELQLNINSSTSVEMPGNDSGLHIIMPWGTGENLIKDNIRNRSDLFAKIETATPIEENQLEIIY